MHTDFRNTIAGHTPLGEHCRRAINPATGKPNEPVPVSTRDDVEMAMVAAKKASIMWGKTPFQDRRRTLLAFSEAIEKSREEFATLLTREQGKPIHLARQEILTALSWLRAFADCDLSDRVVKECERRKIIRRYTPLGVSVGIVPWNYPFSLACGKLGPAVLAGNPIVMKPSPFTPYTCLKLSELAQEYFPPGVVQALSGDDALGPWLTNHSIPEKISFTGSNTTGKRVMEAAAGTLKRVTLELGGNDPAIICGDVDIEATAQQIARLSFLNSGQICLAIKRIYVHESIYDQFLSAMVECVKKFQVGEGNETDVFMGPVQNSMQFDRVKGFLKAAETENWQIAADSPIHDSPCRPGYFVSPTIVDRPPENSRIVTEELFGPIVPLLTWQDEHDVIIRANDTRMGLGASVWSRNLEQAERISRQLEAGSIWINSHFDLDPSVSYGGHKESGLGLELGMGGLTSFCNKQFLYLDKSI
ncbi:aldehyde dehydrogenase [Penicillium angulare]|uniref:aldehyde dehydrogenase (NAD(+)) n=1 Tax=Penicillium angulare TaxID=116970 RepID=A0A9W9G8N3_9EURO|nr:aldehyde dehydrogenase [Penicillium angulare]